MFYEKIGASKERFQSEAQQLVQQMTLEEKTKLLCGDWDIIGNVIKHGHVYNPVPIKSFGCERLGVPGIGFSDGPRGVVMNGSTCFPVSMARGASFDRDLEREIGDVIGKEVRAYEGGNYFAGVCINLLRHPAWGRAQETYGEDPYHVGEFGLQLTESVQAHNVMACVKHYAMNNIENSRFKVDIDCDERTLHEIYLPHFKKCVVDGGAASLMGAYNKFRGERACESKELYQDILRDMWGFQGFVSSDFIFGIRDAKKALEAGMDMEMPSPIYYHNALVKRVNDGEIDVSYIDTACKNVVSTVLAFDKNTDPQSYGRHLSGHQDHIDLAKRAAEECMTLIKNEGNVLPLSKGVKQILVVGNFALTPNTGDKGSSNTFPEYTTPPLAGLKTYFGNSVEIVHVMDSEVEEAKKLAKEVDAVIIFAGCDFSDEGEFLVPDEAVDYTLVGKGYKNKGQPLRGALVAKLIGGGQDGGASSDVEGEGLGGDRSNLGVRPSQTRMIQAIGRINPNTVVNIVAGSMIMTTDWDECVPAIMYNWYSGMEGGNAVARTLFGDANPSGKLPFTTPYSEDDLPYFSTTDRDFTYDFYHGYFLLDKQNIKPMYPFGHGLSYTNFEISNHSCEMFGDRIIVSVDVKNTGEVFGKEVVQVYVGSKNSSVERHNKELKGFEKVGLNPGESKTVKVEVLLKELEYFCDQKRGFVFEDTTYELYVGNTSDNEKLVKLDVDLK